MILIAPTAFKGTISAADAAAAIAGGVRRSRPDERIVELPLSDGGPGLIDALTAAISAADRDTGAPADGDVRRVPYALERIRVTGPRGAWVDARILRCADGTAVLESADACGLHLLAPSLRDPLLADTFGVGELVLTAAGQMPGREDVAATGIVLGLGGSATVDGGAGMARALGWRLLDADGRPITTAGGGLAALAAIEPPGIARRMPPVIALADVRTPLTGAEGAAAVFGPQKGADVEGVARLAAGLERLAEVVARDLGIDIASIEGGGAAGGLGAAAVAFLGAQLVTGSEWVLERTGFDRLLPEATLVITGEGAYDAQTSLGKIVGRVIDRATARGVPVLLMAGRVDCAVPEGVRAVGGGSGGFTAESLAESVATTLARE